MSQTIKLKITADKIDYSKCINAFPSATKEKTIKELRDLTIANKKTKAVWSSKEKQVALNYAYGNQYIRINPHDKKSKDFMLDVPFKNKQHFEEYAAEVEQVQVEEILSGRFDEEIKHISEKMSAARN